jgi:DNA ligase-1
MVKTLTSNATYEPSKRSFNWLKLKKDYLDTSIGDSVDLVVVGADYGVGKRTGYFGSFLLACWNEDRERLETVCKVGTGFSDEALQTIHATLKDLVTSKPPSNLKFKDKNVDEWISPQMVWEIKAADLSLSPIYQAGVGEVDPEKGIALRFPRYIRTRDDKKVEEATSHEQIVEFYRSQAAINVDFNAANDDFDF